MFLERFDTKQLTAAGRLRAIAGNVGHGGRWHAGRRSYNDIAIARVTPPRLSWWR
jgi:hypothetical protein